MKNINLFVPHFRKEEITKHINECLDKGWTGLGYKTLEIENEWKKYKETVNEKCSDSAKALREKKQKDCIISENTKLKERFKELETQVESLKKD